MGKLPFCRQKSLACRVVHQPGLVGLNTCVISLHLQGDSAYKEEPDDAAKVAYVKAALQEELEFECSKPLDADLCEAIKWLGDKTEQEVMDERESVMTVRSSLHNPQARMQT